LTDLTGRSPFVNWLPEKINYHLRVSFKFQAFFAAILAGRMLQRSRGTSLQLGYLSAKKVALCRSPLSKLRTSDGGSPKRSPQSMKKEGYAFVFIRFQNNVVKLAYFAVLGKARTLPLA